MGHQRRPNQPLARKPLLQPHLLQLAKPHQRTTEPTGQTTTYHLRSRTTLLPSQTRKINGQTTAGAKLQPTLKWTRKRQPKKRLPKSSACERRKRHAGARSWKPKLALKEKKIKDEREKKPRQLADERRKRKLADNKKKRKKLVDKRKEKGRPKNAQHADGRSWKPKLALKE